MQKYPIALEFSEPTCPPKQAFQHSRLTKSQAKEVQNRQILEACFVRVRYNAENEPRRADRKTYEHDGNKPSRRQLHHTDGIRTSPTDNAPKEIQVATETVGIITKSLRRLSRVISTHLN